MILKILQIIILKHIKQLKLPLTLVVRGLGIVHMRSAWGDPDATLVGFADNRFKAYAGEAANCFSLWKNGAALFPYRGQISGACEYDPSTTPDNNVVGYYNKDYFWNASTLRPTFTVPKASAALAPGPRPEIHQRPREVSGVDARCHLPDHVVVFARDGIDEKRAAVDSGCPGESGARLRHTSARYALSERKP